jgi:hypothetical protein
MVQATMYLLTRFQIMTVVLMPADIPLVLSSNHAPGLLALDTWSIMTAYAM